MARKTITGADFKAFYSDPQVWDDNGKPGWYVDDLLLRVEGMKDVSMDDLHRRYGDQLDKLPDDASIAIESGYLEWQGAGDPPSGQETDLQARLDQWLDDRTYVTFVATVQVPKNDREWIARVREGLEELGATVTRSDEPTSPTVPQASSPKP